jgi:hypothetical protein
MDLRNDTIVTCHETPVRTDLANTKYLTPPGLDPAISGGAHHETELGFHLTSSRATTVYDHRPTDDRTIVGGVTLGARWEPLEGGRYTKVIFSLTSAVAVSGVDLAIHGDSYDSNQNSGQMEQTTTGFTMASGSTTFNWVAKNHAGVSPDASTFWLGSYSGAETNRWTQVSEASASERDLGMAISWQGINIEAGVAREISPLVGVGALPPGAIDLPVQTPSPEEALQVHAGPSLSAGPSRSVARW